MRRGVIRMGTERGVYLCFPGFAPDDPRAATARLLADALGRDNTSRLDHRLDVRERAVRRVDASANGGFRRYPGVLKSRPFPEGFTNARSRDDREELTGCSTPIPAEAR
jgi:hypothetical protein